MTGNTRKCPLQERLGQFSMDLEEWLASGILFPMCILVKFIVLGEVVAVILMSMLLATKLLTIQHHQSINTIAPWDIFGAKGGSLGISKAYSWL